MRLVHFLTFVLFTTLGLASPDSTITPSPINSGPKSPWMSEGEELITSRTNTPHSFTGFLGYMMGPLVDPGENRSSLYVGIGQTHQNHDFTSQNYGVELTEIGMVGVHLELRTLLSLGRNYEPYWDWGGGALLKPQEGFGSLINYERYQVRLGCGFEDFLRWHRKLRLGLQGAVSPLGLTLFLNMGYSVAD